MAIQRDKLIIIDVESTCWENQAPPGQQSEIIEIGLCLLNLADLSLDGKRSILIRPQRSKVSAFCTQLTTLTQDQVNDGLLFDEACAILQNDYQSKTRLWGSWGNYDRKMFQSQCESFAVPYPFGDQHINLKKLFAKLYKLPKPAGMAGALKLINCSLEGTHHRGDDDALNIGRIVQKMIADHGQEIF